MNLHLWIFNHPFFSGISDQAYFLRDWALFKGFNFSIGKKPSIGGLNFVIENFDEKSFTVIKKFHSETGKKVGIILTEHLDLYTPAKRLAQTNTFANIVDLFEENPVSRYMLPQLLKRFCIIQNQDSDDIGSNFDEFKYFLSSPQIFLHGQLLGSHFSYIPEQVIVQRTNYMINLFPYAASFFRLGDRPCLIGFNRLLCDAHLFCLWYPPLVSREVLSRKKEYDFCFFGSITHFREKVLNILRHEGYSLNPPSTGRFKSCSERDKILQMSKFSLNIPQDNDWPWLSPMRIRSGLLSATPTLSLYTEDTSEISSCCVQLNSYQSQMRMHRLLEHCTQYAEDLSSSYQKLVRKGENYSEEAVNFMLEWLFFET